MRKLPAGIAARFGIVVGNVILEVQGGPVSNVAESRTQPLLPLRPGLPTRQTHDYKRHGTTTLFAALNMLDGKVIGECLPRHRSQEFVRFLKKIDRQTPADLDLHLVVDNYCTHKSPVVKRWLARHKQFHLHFVPTGSSWLNLVERWFGEITRKRIRRGTFKSVSQLIDAITELPGAPQRRPCTVCLDEGRGHDHR